MRQCERREICMGGKKKRNRHIKNPPLINVTVPSDRVKRTMIPIHCAADAVGDLVFIEQVKSWCCVCVCVIALIARLLTSFPVPPAKVIRSLPVRNLVAGLRHVHVLTRSIHARSIVKRLSHVDGMCLLCNRAFSSRD